MNITTIGGSGSSKSKTALQGRMTKKLRVTLAQVVLSPTTSKHSRQSQVLATGSINSPTQGKEQTRLRV